MVRHIVLFRIKDEICQEDKLVIMTKFKNNILALKNNISCIRDIRVDFNINPEEEWDLCLDAVFNTLEDVRYYSKHPDHVSAANELKPFLISRSCVDIEI